MNNENSITLEELELIDAYLHQQLKGEALAFFEERLSADAGWRVKVNEIRLLSLSISEAALEEKLSHFHNEMNRPALKLAHKKNNRKKWLAAAAIIIIVILGVSLLFQKPAHEKLFDAYYKPDPG